MAFFAWPASPAAFSALLLLGAAAAPTGRTPSGLRPSFAELDAQSIAESSGRAADTPFIDVCFLAIGEANKAASYVANAVDVILNIESRQRAQPVRYHLVLSASSAEVQRELRGRQDWQAVHRAAGERVVFHELDTAPQAGKTLHSELARSARGPGPIYLYKPVLHLLLPEVQQLIVLDTDVTFIADISELWSQFDIFGPDEVIGLAAEQAPSYGDVKAQGGVGFNGGVQLLHLARMRTSALYGKLLRGYADGVMPMKADGIGWLGDQTLYSWMTVNSNGAQRAFHILDCGWNWQTGTWLSGQPGFWQSHECPRPCRLLHTNRAEHKPLANALNQALAAHGNQQRGMQRDAQPSTAAVEGSTSSVSAATVACETTVRSFIGDAAWSNSNDAQMLSMVESKCC